MVQIGTRTNIQVLFILFFYSILFYYYIFIFFLGGEWEVVGRHKLMHVSVIAMLNTLKNGILPLHLGLRCEGWPLALLLSSESCTILRLCNKINTVLAVIHIIGMYLFWRVQVWDSSSNQRTKPHFTDHLVFRSSLNVGGWFIWCLLYAKLHVSKMAYRNSNSKLKLRWSPFEFWLQTI